MSRQPSFRKPPSYDPNLLQKIEAQNRNLSADLGFSDEDTQSDLDIDLMSDEDDASAAKPLGYAFGDNQDTQKEHVSFLRAQIDKLQGELKERDARILAVQVEKKAVERKAAEAEHKVDEVMRLSKSAKSSVQKQYKVKIKELQQQLELERQQNSEDDEIMEALHQRIDALESALREHKIDVSETPVEPSSNAQEREQLRSLQRERVSLVAKVNALTEELAERTRSYEGRLKSQDAELMKLRRDHLHVTHNTSTSEHQTKEIELLKAELESVHGQLETIAHEKANLQSKSAAYVEQTRRAETENATLQARIRKLEEDLREQPRDKSPVSVSDTDGPVTELERQRLVKLEQERKLLKEEIKRRTLERSTILARLAELESDRSQREGVLGPEAAGVEQELKSVRGAFEEAKTRCNSLTVQNEELKKALEAAVNDTSGSDAAQHAREQLVASNEHLKAQLERLTAERQQTQTASDEADTLRADLHSARGDLAQAHIDNVHLQEKVASLATSIEGLEAQISAATQISEQKDQQIQSLQTQLQSACTDSTDKASLIEELSKAEAVVSKLSAERSQRDIRLSELTDAHAKTQELLQKREKSLASLKEKAQAKLNIAGESIEKLTSEYKKLRTTYEQLKESSIQRNTELVHQVRDLKAQLETTSGRKQQRYEALRSMKQSCSGLRQQIQPLTKYVSTIPSFMEKCSAAIEQGVQRLVRSQAESQSGLMKKYKDELRKRKQLFNLVQELKGNIRVYCRVRPPTASERKNSIVSFPEDGTIAVRNQDRSTTTTFEFEKVFTPSSTQEDMFAQVKDLVTSVTDGYNVCIFAYGQTGAGKTYTMEGPADNPGVYRRTLTELFDVCRQREPDVTTTLSVSMIEVYNEKPIDLLSNDTDTPLKIINGLKGTEVRGLTRVSVSSEKEVLGVMAQGSRNRSVGRTDMNARSSRSHLIVSVYVDSCNTVSKASYSGKLHLVDLAGSERVSRSNAEGVRLKEAQKINYSLAALGNVIHARANNQGHVPYRDSVLTYLLRDSLEKNSKTLMIVQVSPGAPDASETLCSLKFAERVRLVELGKASQNSSRSKKSSRPASPMTPSGRNSPLSAGASPRR